MTVELDLKSIDALADEDYSCHPGWHTDVYLNPRTGKVYTSLAEDSVPVDAHDGIDQKICRAYSNSVPNSVRDNVLLMDERLRDMLKLFVGTEWTGSDHVGIWKESPDPDHHWREPFDRHFEEHIEIKYYSDPDEWFTDQDLKKLWQGGRSAQEVLDDSELDNGDSCCQYDVALEYLESKWAEFAAEEDELPSEPDDFTYNDH